MAITYDPSLSSARDYLRFLLDESTSDSLIQDEEMDALIARMPIREAASQICLKLSFAYLKKANEMTLLDLKKKWSDRSEQFRKLAQDVKNMDFPMFESNPTKLVAVDELQKPALDNYRTD